MKTRGHRRMDNSIVYDVDGFTLKRITRDREWDTFYMDMRKLYGSILGYTVSNMQDMSGEKV